MKNILVILAGLMLTLSAQAQTKEEIKNGSDTLKLMAGSAQSTASFGLEYEKRTGSFGVGAKVLHSTKNDDVGKAESTTFGAQIVSHLYDNNDMDIYIASGLAITNMDSVLNPADPLANTSDETLFGPTLGIGALYTLNSTWGVGFEYFTIYNWSSQKVADSYGFSNLVVSYNF